MISDQHRAPGMTRDAGLIEAAEYAEFYADERMRLAGDSILHDPVLAGGRRTVENLKKSRDMTVDGTINSAAYHAAKDIASHLRSLVSKAEGRTP